eukprot:scpid105835/ scgid27587/ 
MHTTGCVHAPQDVCTDPYSILKGSLRRARWAQSNNRQHGAWLEVHTKQLCPQIEFCTVSTQAYAACWAVPQTAFQDHALWLSACVLVSVLWSISVLLILIITILCVALQKLAKTSV